jgi:quinoprotein dehydrogenase-associated probable ABC transporter substrate-binding protein
MSMRRLLFRLAPLCAAALGGTTSIGAAQMPPTPSPTGELVARTELRVCADPNSMPFSDEKGEGFENKIAEVLGKDLSLPVKYTWFPQVVGFVRNTLRANRCDLVMGTVAGDDIMQTTTPYYYTSYVLAYRSDSGLSFTDFNDPKLKALHIGIVAGTPPADLLVRHDLMANARPYALTVDTRFESPVHQMLTEIVNKEIDAGLLWGPIAGYYIHKGGMPLKMVLLQNEPGAPRMAYHIAMGVRNNEPEWRRRINAAINGHRDDITAILRDYGIPLLDEQGQAQ